MKKLALLLSVSCFFTVSQVFAQKVYWSDNGSKKVQRSNLDGTGIEDILESFVTSPVAVALDLTAGKIYWSDGARLLRVNLDGSGSEFLLTTTVAINQIALDTNAGKIYWTQGYGGFAGVGGDLRRANLDGSSVEVIPIPLQGVPYGVALDPKAGKVYWTENPATDVFFGTAVRRSNLDGTNDESVGFSPTNMMGPVALDLAAGRVYWSEQGLFSPGNFLRSANLNGSGIQSINLTSPALGLAIDHTGGKVYWTEPYQNKIFRANLNGSNVETLISSGVSGPFGIALHTAANYFLFADSGSAKLRRANLDGSNLVDVLGGSFYNVTGLALDAGTGKMVWTDSVYNKISRANLSGQGIEELITSGLSDPDAIALDPANGKMYWTDYGTNKVQRANLDGSLIQDLATNNLNNPNGLAIDFSTLSLYWADSSAKKITRANLDGSSPQDIPVPSPNFSGGAALDPTHGKIYWVDAGRIRRANVDGSQMEFVVELPQSGTAYDVALDLKNGYLYWSSLLSPPDDSKRIYRSRLDGSQIEDIVTVEGNGLLGIDFDPAEEKIYWVDRTKHSIHRANGDGSEQEEVLTHNLGLIHGMALDLAREKLILADTGLNKIRQVNLDGTEVETLVNQANLLESQVVLDFTAQKIYWTGESAIRRANFDGSQVELWMTQGVEHARGIAIDAIGGKIYWANRGVSNFTHPDGSIWRANLNGSGAESVLTGLNNPDSMGIDISGGKFYWADTQENSTLPGRILRANLDGSNIETIRTSLSDFTGSLVIDPVGNWLYYDSGPFVRRAHLDGSGDSGIGTGGGGDLQAFALNAVQGYLYSARDYSGTQSSIYRKNLANNSNNLVLDEGFRLPNDIAVNPLQNEMFILSQYGIHRGALYGSEFIWDVITIYQGVTFGSNVYLALDPFAEKLYWGNSQAIYRIDTLGGSPQTVIPLEFTGLSTNTPRGIALDIAEGKIIWASTTRLMQANLNGSEMEALISGIQEPTKIQIDASAQKMYWIDRSRILRANVDGSELEELVPANSQSSAVDLALDLNAGKIYWTDRGGSAVSDGMIRRADLDGSNRETLVSGLYTPQAIALLFVPSIQSSSPSPCAIDARQPHEIHDTNSRFGWDSIELQFSASVASLTLNEFSITEIGGDGIAPAIQSLFFVGPNSIQLVLSEAIEAGAWTCFEHIPSGTKSCLGYLPGDVDGDRTASPVDILKLINHLNGIVRPPYPISRTDLNRSGLGEPSDILRLIDMLNGADEFTIWNGSQLPTCPQ